MARLTDKIVDHYIAAKGISKKDLDLTEYPIKIFPSQTLADKIIDSLKYDDNKKITPLGTEILAYGGIKADDEEIDVSDFESRINEMREGTPAEQAIFLKFRRHLIEKEYMPVNSAGYAYDLSKMHVHDFDVPELLAQGVYEESDLLEKVYGYYLDHHHENKTKQKDLVYCANRLKQDSPALFVRFYHYLIDNKFIVPEINLTREQFVYLAQYDSIISRVKELPVVAYVLSYVQRNIQDSTSQDEINRVIETMQYGNPFEKSIYRCFLTMIKDINNMIYVEEKPGRTLIDRARARARAKLGTMAE